MDPISELKEKLFAVKDIPAVESFSTDVHQLKGWRKNLENLYGQIDWSKPPKNVGPLQQAVALWKLGRKKKAIEVLKPAAKKEAEAVLLSRYQIETGAAADAVEVLVKFLKKKTRNAHLKTTMLEAMRRSGDDENWQKKVRAWESDLKGRPDYQYQRARVLEERGDYREAMEVLRAELKNHPEHRGMLFRLALLEQRLGTNERAIGLYERIRALRPTYVNALINLSVLYEDQGRYEKAHRVLREVLSEFPTHERAKRFERDVVSSKDMYYDEDLERKHDKRMQVLRTPVTDFELSVRSRNCLKQMNIDTLGDLVTKTEQELLSHKNFGETSLAEIKAMLAQRNLRLGMAKKGEDIPGFADVRSGRNREVLSRPIGELELSVRSRKCMERMNITTIGELCNMSDQDLLAVRNFGQTSLVEIRTKLGELSLKLKGDP